MIPKKNITKFITFFIFILCSFFVYKFITNKYDVVFYSHVYEWPKLFEKKIKEKNNIKTNYFSLGDFVFSKNQTDKLFKFKKNFYFLLGNHESANYKNNKILFPDKIDNFYNRKIIEKYYCVIPINIHYINFTLYREFNSIKEDLRSCYGKTLFILSHNLPNSSLNFLRKEFKKDHIDGLREDLKLRNFKKIYSEFYSKKINSNKNFNKNFYLDDILFYVDSNILKFNKIFFIFGDNTGLKNFYFKEINKKLNFIYGFANFKSLNVKIFKKKVVFYQCHFPSVNLDFTRAYLRFLLNLPRKRCFKKVFN